MSSFLQPQEDGVRDTFIVCVQCFRVRQGAGWIDADEVIRQTRTFEHPAVPTLRSGLCDNCAALIADRRGGSYDAAAA